MYIALLTIGALVYHSLMINRSDLFLYVVYLTVDSLLLVTLFALFTGKYQSNTTILTYISILASMLAFAGLVYYMLWKNETNDTNDKKDKYDWIGLTILGGLGIVLAMRLRYKPDVEVLFKQYNLEEDWKKYDDMDDWAPLLPKSEKSSDK